jgi:hypothetical protein
VLRGLWCSSIGEVHDDFDGTEMARPVGPRVDVADRPNLGAWYRCCPAARYAQDIVAARSKAAAYRIADKSRCAGHQNARQHILQSSACVRMAQAISAQMH